MQEELTTFLLQAKGGSEEAFSDLVRRLEGRIYRGAMALTANTHDARDLTQETFIRAYLGLRRQHEIYCDVAKIALDLFARRCYSLS